MLNISNSKCQRSSGADTE